MGREKECYCKTCEREFYHLGIASHRSVHRRKGEDCEISYGDGRTITHYFSGQRYYNFASGELEKIESQNQ